MHELVIKKINDYLNDYLFSKKNIQKSSSILFIIFISYLLIS